LHAVTNRSGYQPHACHHIEETKDGTGFNRPTSFGLFERILAVREQLENLIDQLIELLDRLDGDPDIELDPAEDGIADFDGLIEQVALPGFRDAAV
jgi:hypothetical protein